MKGESKSILDMSISYKSGGLIYGVNSHSINWDVRNAIGVSRGKPRLN